MRTFVLLCMLIILAGCSKSKDDGVKLPEAPKNLAKAILITPLPNEPCYAGIVKSATESLVTFKWNAGEGAENYELTYKNLQTGTSVSVVTDKTTVEVLLLRNMPYSWTVLSKSTKSTVMVSSDTWKFYNAGEGITSYVPYPAEIVSPLFAELVSSVGGKVTLSWTGADADNDLLNYDIYLDTESGRTLLKSAYVSSVLSGLEVIKGKTYYWKVVSRDFNGNTSSSGLYQFTIK